MPSAIALNCSGSQSPQGYIYSGPNSRLSAEGRYDTQCFEGGVGKRFQTVAEVDLSKDWWSYGIQVDTNSDKLPDTETTLISNPVLIQGKRAINLKSFPLESGHPSINPKDPNPFAGGMAIALKDDGRYLPATQLEIWILPETPGTLILELYDQDKPTPANQCADWSTTPPGPKDCLAGGLGKDPKNYYLPTTGDEFVVKLPLNPTGQWQKLVIPLDKFIDWNRRRDFSEKPDAREAVRGITEKLGDGLFNPEKGEEVTLQLTLVGHDWKSPINLNIGQTVKFLKPAGAKK